MTDHKPKYSRTILGFVILIIIAILGWSLMNSKNYTNRTSETSDEVLNDDQEQTIIETSFVGIYKNDWEYYDNAIEDVQSLDEDQEIYGVIVPDPNEDNIFYFASNAFSDATDEVLISIYKYNTDDYSFERLFRHSYKADEFPNMKGLVAAGVFGYESGSLVLTITTLETNGPICGGPFTRSLEDDGYFDLVSIKISDPYSGFSQYTPSEEQLEAEQEEIERCEEEV